MDAIKRSGFEWLALGRLDFNSIMDAIKRGKGYPCSFIQSNFNSIMDAIKPFLPIPLYQRFRHTKWIKKSATLSDSQNPGRPTDFIKKNHFYYQLILIMVYMTILETVYDIKNENNIQTNSNNNIQKSTFQPSIISKFLL